MCIYVRPLTPAERPQVEQMLRSTDAVTHRHARVVLLSSQGQKVTQIMPLVGLSDRQVRKIIQDRKSTRLNSSHIQKSRMPSSA